MKRTGIDFIHSLKTGPKLVFPLLLLRNYFSGSVTRNDVISVLPFRNTVTMVELRGSDLRDVFEHAVGDYGTDYISGRFLQVSGQFSLKILLSK